MRPTGEGKRFLLATVLIAVAAFNTGNNLIYLILALMLSFVFLSVLVLKYNLSGLSVDSLSNAIVFAGEAAPFSLILKNKKSVPSYSVRTVMEGMSAPAYFPFVAASGEAVEEVEIVFGRRGLYGYGTFSIESGFPFILLRDRKNARLSGEVLVYPALLDPERIIPDLAWHEAGNPGGTKGAGEEVHSLREFRNGDDRRRIHWKASARASELLVREYSEQDARRTTIVLDNLGQSREVPGHATDEVFERAVSLAASLSKYFIDAGHQVRFMSCRKVVSFGMGDEHLLKVLDVLAVIGKEEEWESPMPFEGEGNIISVVRSRSGAAGRLAAISDRVLDAEQI